MRGARLEGAAPRLTLRTSAVYGSDSESPYFSDSGQGAPWSFSLTGAIPL